MNLGHGDCQDGFRRLVWIFRIVRRITRKGIWGDLKFTTAVANLNVIVTQHESPAQKPARKILLRHEPCQRDVVGE